MLLASILVLASGCDGSGDTGSGTVDISKAKKRSSSSPEISKAAANRGAGGLKGTGQNGSR